MIEYPSQASLSELQRYQREVCRERGWDEASDLEIYLLLSEEVGELAKAIRKRRQLFNQERQSSSDNVGEELADVFSYLLDLSERLGVDLEAAYRAKEEHNRQRSWGGRAAQ